MKSRLGAHVLGENRGTSFGLWAPRAHTVEVAFPLHDMRAAMQESEPGVFTCEVRELGAGTDYWYVIDGHTSRPDPRSLSQPAGVHGPSRVADTSRFLWSDAGFRCPPLQALSIYELHIGTFTEAGTFDAAIARLAHLVELGVNAVEIMPIAEFPGERNWGYDGVFPYAPQSTYGGPEGFALFVDACHAHGLAVVLDVVYNHLGPEGNYLGDFAPYFTDRYKTDWGSALNFDGPDSDQARRYVIDNALFWLRDYHVDALRLDAVHAIYDLSARHILEELRDEVDIQAARLGRAAYLIAESDLNDARVIRPIERGGLGMHAQWSDDFHHALRTLITPHRAACLGDFGRVEDLARAYTNGYVYDGRYSEHRRRRHGNSSLDVSGEQLVVYQQNHDQVGNTSQGARIGALAGLEGAKLAAVALLSAPNVPMLFMGEEFFAQTPFAYFISHSDDALNAAVSRGRKHEHAAFGAAEAWLDPAAEATFASSKLDWTTLEREPHAGVFQLYRDLFALRKRHACLARCDKTLTRVSWDDAGQWLALERGAAVSDMTDIIRGDESTAVAVLGQNLAAIPVAEPGELALCLFNFSSAVRRVTPPSARGNFRRVLSTDDARYAGPLTSSPIGIGESTLKLKLDTNSTIELPPLTAAIYLNVRGAA
jgi:maltooligosyltrehalose trehalohydrolase